MHRTTYYNSRPSAHSARLIGFCLLLLLSLSTLRAAEDDTPAIGTVQPEVAAVTTQFAAAISSNDVALAYFQLQDQVFATQFALERARQDFQKAASQNAVAVSNHLYAIQGTLLAQDSQLAEARHMNHLLLGSMGVFALVVLGVVGLTVYFQSRAMNRLADISAELSASRGMALAIPPGGSAGLQKALSNGAVEQSNARLLGLVEVLEKRIGELEQTAGVRVKQKPIANGNGHTQKPAELTLDASKELIRLKEAVPSTDVTKKAVAPTTTTADLIVSSDVSASTDLAAPKDIVVAPANVPATSDLPAPQEVVAPKDLAIAKDVAAVENEEKPKTATSTKDVTAGWMERAQSFMAADRPEDALAYFDAILATEPKNAEAMVKKGMALEKLSRPQEALEYYDRAIAADNNLTIAHLQRGGLCNRLEKHSEAIESYEQALRTRE
jgi:tetratricopeptide (TPR) repeat protein